MSLLRQELLVSPLPQQVTATSTPLDLPPGEFDIGPYRDVPHRPQSQQIGYAPLEVDPPPTSPPSTTFRSSLQPLEVDPPGGAPPPSVRDALDMPVRTGRPPVRGNFPSVPSPQAPPASAVPGGGLRAGAAPAAIGAGIDFGLRLASGQSPEQAAGGAIASGVGSLAGGAIGGAIGGIPGAWAGSMIGGFIGGKLYDSLRPENLEQTRQRLREEVYDIQTNPPGIPNYLTFNYSWPAAGVFNSTSEVGLGVSRIVGLGSEIYEPTPGNRWRRMIIKYVQFSGGWNNWGVELPEVKTTYSLNSPVSEKDSDFKIYWNLNLKSRDGKSYPWHPLNKENLDPYTNDRRSPESMNHPTGMAFSPRGSQGSFIPPRESGNFPRTGTPQGNRDPVPQVAGLPDLSRPSPSPTANPFDQPQQQQSPQQQQQQTPQQQQQQTPQQQQQQQQTPQQQTPQQQTPQFIAQNPSQNPSYIPGSSVSINNSPSNFYNPSSPPQVETNPFRQQEQLKQPETLKYIPPLDSQKARKPPDKPEEKTDKSIQELQTELLKQGAALAALTTLLKGLDSKVDKLPEENCKRCVKPQMDSLLDRLMQGADLALLGTINNKLGPQIPNGGIAGNLLRMTDFLKDKFDKLWKSFRLDRIISMLTLAASIHNAAMLSRELGETLLETLETILQAIQGWMPDFLKSPDGDGFDLDELLKAKLEKFLQDLLGAENYVALKTSWIRANRILSTAANMLNAMRSMLNAITEGLQVVAGWIAMGFNGIQREGLVSDKTWPWMDERPNFQSKQIGRFTNKLDNLEEAASSIQQLAGSSIEFTSEAKELTEETQKLIKLLDEKQEATTKKEVEEGLKSQAALISDDDLEPGTGPTPTPTPTPTPPPTITPPTIPPPTINPNP